jgi:hypothetical protein
MTMTGIAFVLRIALIALALVVVFVILGFGAYSIFLIAHGTICRALASPDCSSSGEGSLAAWSWVFTATCWATAIVPEREDARTATAAARPPRNRKRDVATIKLSR